MEKRLKALFDYQKFQDNKRLSKMIADAEGSIAEELTDDELFMVSAAGETDILTEKDNCHDT